MACGQLAGLLCSITVLVIRGDPGAGMLPRLSQDHWLDAVRACLTAVNALWPATRPGPCRTEAASSVVRAYGALLVAAFSDCEEVRAQPPEGGARLHRRSSVMLCVDTLWGLWLWGLLVKVLQVAPVDAVAGLVLLCETCARSPLHDAALVRAAAPPELALLFSLQMLLARVLQATGDCRPWLPMHSQDNAMPLNTAVLRSWESAAVVLDHVTRVWQRAVTELHAAARLVDAMQTVGLPPLNRAIQSCATTAVMDEVTSSGSKLISQLLSVVASLTPQTPPAVSAASVATRALAALEALSEPDYSHLLWYWGSLLSGDLEGFKQACNTMGPDDVELVLEEQRHTARTLSDMVVRTLQAVQRVPSASALTPSLGALRTACKLADGLIHLASLESHALQRMQLSLPTAGRRLDWAAAMQAMQVVAVLQSTGNLGCQAVSEQLGPTWLLNAAEVIVHGAGLSLTRAVLPPLRLMCQALVTEAQFKEASQQQLAQVYMCGVHSCGCANSMYTLFLSEHLLSPTAYTI